MSFTTLDRPAPGSTAPGPQVVSGRQLLAALGGWICLSVAVGAATIVALRVLAPGWDPTGCSGIGRQFPGSLLHRHRGLKVGCR